MTNYLIHRQWMNRAVELAQAAGDAGEVPVGAVIVDGTGKLIAQAQNRRERDCDPTAHAEILAYKLGSVCWYTEQMTQKPARFGLWLIFQIAPIPVTGCLCSVAFWSRFAASSCFLGLKPEGEKWRKLKCHSC